MGQPTSFRNNMSFLKGGMAMLSYFGGFGTQAALLRSESGTVGAISGILKAPFDILADKLRGYKGLCMDLFRQPQKVLAACEALAPHLLHVALSGADPDKNVPIGLWMHRGCVPFLSPSQFERYYWPTLKWIIEELWARGHQTLFYAEGEWNPNLKWIAQLPERSIVYHVDRGDIFEVHKAVGEKFCISGGVPNDLLAFGTPEDVRAVLQEGDRRRGPRRRIHHGRQRHHAGRHEGGKPQGDDRVHAGIRSVLTMSDQPNDKTSARDVRALGGESARRSPRSPATRNSSSGCGRTSMRWATCTFGRYCCRFSDAVRDAIASRLRCALRRVRHCTTARCVSRTLRKDTHEPSGKSF